MSLRYVFFFKIRPLKNSRDASLKGCEVYAATDELMTHSWSEFNELRVRLYPREHLPRNALVVNTIVDAKQLQRDLLTAFGDRLKRKPVRGLLAKKSRVVIYGRGIVVQAAVASAIDAGVGKEDLVVVLDEPDEDDGNI